MKISARKGTLYLTASSFFFVVSGYGVNILLGRTLGPEQYGVYGVVISLVSFINVIQISGITQAVSKYVAEDNKKADSVLKSGFTLQIVSTILFSSSFLIFSRLIAGLLNDYSLIIYLQIAALIFPAYGLYALYSDFYNGLHAFNRQAIMNIAYSLSKLFLVLFFALAFQLKGAFLGFIISPFVALLTGIRIPKNTSSFSYKKLLALSIPLIGFAVIANLLQSIDLLFVKSLSGSSLNAGYYTANQNIARVPFYSMSALFLVIFPKISNYISSNNISGARRIIHASLRAVVLIIIPSVFLISITSSKILEFIYSKTYIPGANSLSILTFGLGFITIFMLLSYILNGAGKPSVSLINSFISLIVIIILCVILVPPYGLIGAAIATTVGGFIAMVLAAFFVYKNFRALLSIVSVVRIIISSLIVYFLALTIQIPVFLLPILYIILFGIYFGLLLLLKEITKEELKVAWGLFPAWVRIHKLK